ncbi:MAG: hypothetical protein GXP25_24395 [Planctomycetes bacterium]|nr:hypothetical protein [Planctomycetota bacterium]
MTRLEMCGEEILRLASSRRKGPCARRVFPGDALHRLIQAALEADEPMLSAGKTESGFHFD